MLYSFKNIQIIFVDDGSSDNTYKKIKELTEMGELDGISSKITEKGLLLTFDEKYLFAPATAYLDKNAKIC